MLAIAGLIFLMVFIALPALQRSQRNQEYKNNVSLIVGAIQNYKSNNRGDLPPATGNDGYYPRNANNDGLKNHPMYSYFEALNLPKNIDSIKIFDDSTNNYKFTVNNWWAVTGRIIVMKNLGCPDTGGTFRTVALPQKMGKAAVITLLDNGDNRHASQADFPIYCEEI